MRLHVYVMPLWRFLAGDYPEARARFDAVDPNAGVDREAEVVF